MDFAQLKKYIKEKGISFKEVMGGIEVEQQNFITILNPLVYDRIFTGDGEFTEVLNPVVTPEMELIIRQKGTDGVKKSVVPADFWKIYE